MSPPTFPTFNAICFPADDRVPHVVDLMVSARSVGEGQGCTTLLDAVHPDLHMEHISKNVRSPWRYQVDL